MKTELNEFKLRVLKHVSKELKKNGRDSTKPCMYIKTNKGQFKILHIPQALFGSTSLKEKAKEVMKGMNKEANSDFCCFVSEARISSAQKGDLPEDLERKLSKYSKAQSIPDNLKEEIRKHLSGSKEDSIFFNFENKRKELEGELMVFTVDSEGNMAPSKITNMINSNKSDSTVYGGIFTDII